MRTGPTRGNPAWVKNLMREVEANVTRPMQQVCGFVRVTLNPGERRRETFQPGADQLAFTGVDGRLRPEPGRIDLMVGSSSADIHCHGSIEVVGETAILDHRERFFSTVMVS